MEARYLRIKNWRDHQHYGKRKPPWIKLKNAIICEPESGFAALDELEQWQLVRIWLFASRSEVEIPDPDWAPADKEEQRSIPLIAYDERTIRLGIRSEKKVPVEKFIRLGFLIPMSEDEVASTHASAGASADASTSVANRGGFSTPEESEKAEKDLKAVPSFGPPAGVYSLPLTADLEAEVDKLMRLRGVDDNSRGVVAAYVRQLPLSTVADIRCRAQEQDKGIRWVVKALQGAIEERSVA